MVNAATNTAFKAFENWALLTMFVRYFDDRTDQSVAKRRAVRKLIYHYNKPGVVRHLRFFLRL